METEREIMTTSTLLVFLDGFLRLDVADAGKPKTSRSYPCYALKGGKVNYNPSVLYKPENRSQLDRMEATPITTQANEEKNPI